MLVAAMNPCPCGFFNVPNAPKACVCSPMEINRYQKKISGPLMDRIDLYIDVPPVQFEKLTNESLAEGSNKIRERVQRARDIQTKRFAGLRISSNAEMSPELVKKVCKLTEKQKEFLGQAMRQLKLSARSFHRILKIARTIADLEAAEELSELHLAEALQYRPKIIEA
jgi:magnesium chelatase family protein